MSEAKEDLLWAMLPEGLEEWFDVESHSVTDKKFKIVLIERNIVPELAGKYKGGRIENTILKPITVDFFPIRGRKGELIIKRRMWKVKGVKTWLKRDVKICNPGTQLEQEFADFLKERGKYAPSSFKPYLKDLQIEPKNFW